MFLEFRLLEAECVSSPSLHGRGPGSRVTIGLASRTVLSTVSVIRAFVPEPHRGVRVNSQARFLHQPSRLGETCPRTRGFPSRLLGNCEKGSFGQERVAVLIWAQNKNLGSSAEAEIFPRFVPAIEMIPFKHPALNKN